MNYHGTEAIIVREHEMVFGDGCHESTQMVLEALYQQKPKGKSVLDIGTGTGIQTIFAKMWGATDVLAVDVDTSAIRTARKNFVKNGIEATARLNIYNEYIEDKYDITVANLPTDCVIEFLTMAKQTMAENGVIIFSWSKQFGIHEAHLEQNGYEIVEHLEGIDWDAYVVRSR